METTTHIPEDARSILRDYAEGPHYTHDLMIGTANKVERALAYFVGIELPGTGYRPGLTRLYSRLTQRGFPDENVQHLKDPKAFLNKVAQLSLDVVQHLKDKFGLSPNCDLATLDNTAIREIYRKRIAKVLGISPAEVGNGHIRRLLDKPEICDLLIQYFNEYRVREFKQKLSESQFYRAGRHRIPESKNRAKHQKPATLGSYILRALCSEDTPSVENKGKTLSNLRNQVLRERSELLAHAPIDPDRISDEALKKVGLAPPDFDTYTLQARRRYKMAASSDFLKLLMQADATYRPQGNKRPEQQEPTTARIISFLGADGKEKIGIFSTVTESHTREMKSGSTTKNRHHRVSDAELRIFTGRDEARRSQEHAMENMQETKEIYEKLLNNLKEYMKKHNDKKTAFLEQVVREALGNFKKRKSFHGNLVLRYLEGSNVGKPTLSILKDPSIIGPLTIQLKNGIDELSAKIREIGIIKDFI